MIGSGSGYYMNCENLLCYAAERQAITRLIQNGDSNSIGYIADNGIRYGFRKEMMCELV
jgi:hypothetical protein